MDFINFTSCKELPTDGIRTAIINNTIEYAKTIGYIGDGSLSDLETLFNSYNYTDYSSDYLHGIATDKVGFFADCMNWFRYYS